VTEQRNTTEDFDFNSTSDDTNLEENFTTDVEVKIEKIAERKRQITATIQIPQSVEHVWKVLTDYEALAEFIPNLAKSRRLAHPTGGIRLEQVGSQRVLNFNFCARVVLDLEECFQQTINFQMVEGDFKDYSGSWCLEPYCVGEDVGTNLCYTINIWTKVIMPVTLIERRLKNDLQLNLLAIRQRVEELAT
jgi:ribosome-associated toxin RatA of RatAB toxin-antitoxin module